MKHKYDNKITDYWMQNYCDPVNHMCTLCGQSGVIHSEGIRTPAGLLVGRANYCICPNGQAMREQSGNPTPDATDLAKAGPQYGSTSNCIVCGRRIVFCGDDVWLHCEPQIHGHARPNGAIVNPPSH